ncbi:YolD-like family protein [Bacillus gobiensis]|uniref:YolD-like family protein n=1 Tax=Bacillus gobiensis TaxID=1441095 RepID=UPI003D1F000D
MSEHLRRGNMLWEGSRMFLPEHKEALLQRKQMQKKKIRPALDFDQLEEMDRILHEAMEFAKPIQVTYFQEGDLHICEGRICRLEMLSKKLWITDTSSDIQPPIHLENVTDLKIL